MKIKNKFTIADNPMAEGDGEIFVIHHQQPIAHIRVHHEAITLDASTRFDTFNYMNSDKDIETITFELTHCFFEGKILPDEDVEKRLMKLMNDARHWYCAYLKFIDNDDE